MSKQREIWYNMKTRNFHYMDSKTNIEWEIDSDGIQDSRVRFMSATNQSRKPQTYKVLVWFLNLNLLRAFDFELLDMYMKDFIYRDRRYKNYPSFDEYRELLNLIIVSQTQHIKRLN